MGIAQCHTLTAASLGAGETTYAGFPASLGYEQIDAETFAEWGIDCTYLGPYLQIHCSFPAKVGLMERYVLQI
jgi:hypothetical protein